MEQRTRQSRAREWGRVVGVACRGRRLASEPLCVRRVRTPQHLVHNHGRVCFHSLHEGGWRCLSKSQMHTRLNPAITQTNPTDKLIPKRNDECTKILTRTVLEQGKARNNSIARELNQLNISVTFIPWNTRYRKTELCSDIKYFPRRVARRKMRCKPGCRVCYHLCEGNDCKMYICDHL